jgi:hypothetical protein
MHWRHAEETDSYAHPHAAMHEAFEIIQDEWRPTACSLRQLIYALEHESVACYWEKAIRIVRMDLASPGPAVAK